MIHSNQQMVIDHTFSKTALSHDPRLPSCLLQEAAHVFGTVIGGEAVFFFTNQNGLCRPPSRPPACLARSCSLRCMPGLCFSPAPISDFWHLTSHDLTASMYLCKYHREAQFSVLDSCAVVAVVAVVAVIARRSSNQCVSHLWNAFLPRCAYKPSKLKENRTY